MEYTLLDDGKPHSLPATAVTPSQSGQLSISEAALRETLGWELKPEGLCRDSVCVPVRDRGKLTQGEGIDLTALGEALGRPSVIDASAGVVAFGTSAVAQTAAMETLEAPDFELPDLSGQVHRLSDHRGKKILFIAYASW